MKSKLPLHLHEILFSSSVPEESRKINALVKKGALKKLAPKIFTSNLEDAAEDIIKRNIFLIIGTLYPGVLLSHRSALEFRPTSSGDLFLTNSHHRKIKLPGVTLNIMEGPKALAGDNAFTAGLFVSQQARALLENMQETRKPGPQSKTLTLPEIEDILEKVINAKGEDGLNLLRDQAKEISTIIGLEKEFVHLNKLIGAMLRTNSAVQLTSPGSRARAQGIPYDAKRNELFINLFVELKQKEFTPVPDPNLSVKAFRNFAFFDAYFSNYIEGTEFGIEDAKRIIETQQPMPNRDADSHDVLGTYKILSNRKEMQITPETPQQLIDILQYRHQILLSARPSKKPGEFKDQNNRAGNTFFVDYKLVRGTLIRGFDYYKNLNDPMAKAIFMMFMVSEVHPFLDGNGRIARVMMNAELSAKAEAKIIIPTVYREDYMGALKQFSKQHIPDAYIRMLQRAQLFSSTVRGEEMDIMQMVLENSNAFDEPSEAKLKIMGK
ncbi:Fic family protein [Pedobacter duraquae]|uniref:Fic/DOC family protein n=1 Tax=Pedobacter duraquae TaxID=425511 RepID=A0A4R6IGL5_9SPHI|nr:Fic family protein [Pedobacter duraquae]TDO21302.1 Fic/DOC family protein [Pedobacter duraquae]